jgi:hypothetical protein
VEFVETPAGSASVYPVAVNHIAYEEQFLLNALRVLDRVRAGTLGPVERATISGAKAMFDELASECDKVLKRKVSDLVREPAASAPTFDPEVAARPAAKRGSRAPRTKKTTSET